MIVFGQTYGLAPGQPNTLRACRLPLGEGDGSVCSAWHVRHITRQVMTFEVERDGQKVVFLNAKEDMLVELEDPQQ
jgi:hypothetical protein